MKNIYVIALLYIILLVPLNSCAQTDWKRIKKPNAKMQLRSGGVYNTYDTSLNNDGIPNYKYYSLREILIIIDSSRVIYEYGGGHLNFAPLKLSYYNDKFLMPSIGSYKIDGKLIIASVPIGLMLRGMRLKTFQANFQGMIKNEDTIINWHMVEPYPPAPRKFNDGFEKLIKPKLLYFIQNKELLGLDSLYQSKLKSKTISNLIKFSPC